MSDLNNLLKTELLEKCEKLGITKCKTKSKKDLVELILKETSKRKKLLSKMIL